MAKRRCTVDFDAPRYVGNARHAQPLTRTWTIAAKIASPSMSATPPPCGRTRAGGTDGLANSHKPSGTIHTHCPPMASTATN